TVLGMVLLAPVAWEHYLVFLLLPMTLGWRGGRRPLVRLLVWDLTALLFLQPLDTRFPFLQGWVGGSSSAAVLPWQTFTCLSLGCYAFLGLFALGVLEAFQLRAPLTPNPSPPRGEGQEEDTPARQTGEVQ